MSVDASFLVAEAESALVPSEVRPLVLPRRRTVRDRGWLIRRALLVADVTALLAAFALAAALTDGLAALGTLGFRDELGIFAGSLPLWVVLTKIYGLYDSDEGPAYHSTIDDFGRLFHVLTVGTCVYVLAGYGLGLGDPDLLGAAVFWAAAIGLVASGRTLARRTARSRVEYLQNTIIVGGGEVGQTVARRLLLHPEYGINLVGFVDGEPKELGPELEHLALLGPTDDLEELVRMLDVERAIIAFSNESHEDVLDLIRELKRLNVHVDIVPRLFDLIGPGVQIHTIEGMPLIGLSKMRLSRSSRFLKRALDLGVAGVALTILSPLLALVAVAIRLDTRGPALFQQIRIGEGGRPFRVYKFRTMVLDAEERKHEFEHLNRHAGSDPRMFKIINDPRVTRVGRLLRKYFLDELPQLGNVLKGEMSLIGPRPLIAREACHVDDWGRRRLDLKPGMTGYWQVLGHSAITFEEMVKLDYLYVTTWSLGNDLRLLLQTVPLVVRGDATV